MILDRLENSAAYEAVHPLLRAGFRYLKAFDPSTPDGRVSLRGDDCYALVQTFVPDPEDRRRFEAHRQYLDIQCVLQGRERILVESIVRLEPATSYDAANDITFFRDSGAPTSLVLSPGDFTVFLPQDGHKACCTAGDSSPVRKVVVKIRMTAAVAAAVA